MLFLHIFRLRLNEGMIDDDNESRVAFALDVVERRTAKLNDDVDSSLLAVRSCAKKNWAKLKMKVFFLRLIYDWCRWKNGGAQTFLAHQWRKWKISVKMCEHTHEMLTFRSSFGTCHWRHGCAPVSGFVARLNGVKWKKCEMMEEFKVYINDGDEFDMCGASNFRKFWASKIFNMSHKTQPAGWSSSNSNAILLGDLEFDLIFRTIVNSSHSFEFITC